MSSGLDLSFINTRQLMTKDVYDQNDDQIVTLAENIAGIDTASANSFYGKQGGVVGFYDTSTLGGGGATELSNLVDVDLTGLSAGQFLQYDGEFWVPGSASGGGASTLNELTDVTITTPTSNQVIKFDGTTFVNSILNYSDLSGTPVLSAVATTGSYNDLSNTPTLSSVATSGDYADLTNKPTLSSVATTGSYNDLTNRPTLSTVATTGSYSDLTNKPTLSTVATSGDYADLSNKPTIPSALSDLSDVNTSGVTNGQVLQYNGSTFVPATIPTGGGGASTLNDLTDVDTSGAAAGEVLQYNGTTWEAAPMPVGVGTVTVERIRIQYTGGGMAMGAVGTSDCYSQYSANVTPILAQNSSSNDFITEITFTGYNFPPASIYYYGFDAANNRYEIRPIYQQATMNTVPNDTTDLVNPSPFGAFTKIRLTTATSDTSAAPKTGLPTTPGHAWIVMVMQG